MILILLIIFVFVFAWSMIFLPNGSVRSAWNTLSFIVIAGSLIMIVLNDNYHWGMHQVTTTQTVDLLPLKTTQAALGVKRLGTGTEKVVVYRTAIEPKKLQQTSATTTTQVSLITGRQAKVQITTKRWRYRDRFAKLCFNLGQHDGGLASRHYRFTLPTAWKTVMVPTKTK